VAVAGSSVAAQASTEAPRRQSILVGDPSASNLVHVHASVPIVINLW
jgi:hypothetical protein